MKSIIIMATMLEAKSAIEEFGFVEVGGFKYLTFKNESKYLVISDMGLDCARDCANYVCENFDFDEMLNIGACGALSKEVSFMQILEPKSFVKADALAKPKEAPVLLSYHETICLDSQRQKYAKIADIVDMEAYELKQVCDKYNKNFRAIKYVSDFSENCKINENIRNMRDCLNHQKELWI